MNFVIVVNKRVGYGHMTYIYIYVCCWVFSSFQQNIPCHISTTLNTSPIASWCCHGAFSGRIHWYTKWLNGGHFLGRRRKKLSLISQLIIDSAHLVSVILNILAGFENYGIWAFSRNALSDDFKVLSVACGGSHEPSVLSMASLHYQWHK